MSRRKAELSRAIRARVTESDGTIAGGVTDALDPSASMVWENGKALLLSVKAAPPRRPDEFEGWTPKLVRARLGRAYYLCERTTGRPGPKMFGAAWPAYLPEFSDEVAQVQEGTHGLDGNRIRFRANTREITQMEEALSWPGRYVRDPVLREWLHLDAWIKADKPMNPRTGKKLKLDDVAKRAGISLATAKRRRDKAHAKISIGLTLDGVAP